MIEKGEIQKPEDSIKELKRDIRDVKLELARKAYKHHEHEFTVSIIVFILIIMTLMAFGLQNTVNRVDKLEHEMIWHDKGIVSDDSRNSESECAKQCDSYGVDYHYNSDYGFNNCVCGDKLDVRKPVYEQGHWECDKTRYDSCWTVSYVNKPREPLPVGIYDNILQMTYNTTVNSSDNDCAMFNIKEEDIIFNGRNKPVELRGSLTLTNYMLTEIPLTCCFRMCTHQIWAKDEN